MVEASFLSIVGHEMILSSMYRAKKKEGNEEGIFFEAILESWKF
jgi:hypothetical protein